jgi:hypothetical protein
MDALHELGELLSDVVNASLGDGGDGAEPCVSDLPMRTLQHGLQLLCEGLEHLIVCTTSPISLVPRE